MVSQSADRNVRLLPLPCQFAPEEFRTMTTSAPKAVKIVIAPAKTELSKAQKAFNRLIKQLEVQRTRLAEWEAVSATVQERYRTEMLPLLDKFTDLQIQMVRSLDRVSGRKGLTKSECKLVSELLCDVILDIQQRREDDELKVLYQKHGGVDLDEEEAAIEKEEVAAMREMFEGMFGVDLGGEDESATVEELFEKAQERLEAKQSPEFPFGEEKAAPRPRKQTAKQLAREEKRLAEEKQVSQSIREVYRKLASALHPDREPDPQERERKTELMKRVNIAYDKKNLLQLLELQLELEHIDQSEINRLSEDRLRHYNKILKEQLEELNMEIQHIEGEFSMQFDWDPFTAMTPEKLLKKFTSDLTKIRKNTRVLKNELLVFEDVRALKEWLKQMKMMKRAQKESWQDDFSF